MNDAYLETYLPKFCNRRTAVVGDFMLDRYVWGVASRISQEAPVPVVQIQNETQSPGGAANVANNITSLGGQAVCYGIVGDDASGRQLCDILQQLGADISGIMTVATRPTTVKTRVIADRQQVVRIDAENTAPVDHAEMPGLRNALLNGIAEQAFDAIIFEDYAKGLLTADFIQEVLDHANAAGIITALDPHPRHNFKLHGLTVMTPNRAEAFGLTGVYHTPGILPLSADTALIEVGQQLRKDWRMQHLLITLGPHGMALFTDQQTEPLHIPTRAIEVFDVSGAGDTVTASYILALLAGASPAEAAALANHAAGIVVGKVGTLPVHAEELREHLHEPRLRADECGAQAIK